MTLTTDPTRLQGLHCLRDLLPPRLLDAMRTLRQALRVPAARALLQANAACRGRYQGQRVWVLGNGPSLALVDRAVFRDDPVIVMNNFHRANWKHEVRAVAHCIGEPPDSPGWTDPTVIINGTLAETYWLPVATIGQMHGLAPGKVLHHVLAGIEPRRWGERAIDLCQLSLGYQTTAILAIEVALHLGFSDIRLLGFDHDWLASPDYSRHFYSAEKDQEDKLDSYSYLQVLQMVMRMWEGYYALRRAATVQGAVITNWSHGSYLDVFERRSLPGQD